MKKLSQMGMSSAGASDVRMPDRKANIEAYKGIAHVDA
jgi:hypothetical protein